jgi:hypothetical protein
MAHSSNHEKSLSIGSALDDKVVRGNRRRETTQPNNEEPTMKYLCLIYEAETLYATMSREEGQTMMAEYGAFTEEIKKSGQYIAGEALKPVQTATTVRIRNGKLSMTDGPFAETKEQLGGFYLIEAADLNEAVQIAGRIPSAKTGSIEVRPIQVFG